MSWISIHFFTTSSQAIFSQYLLYSRARSHLFKQMRQYSCLCPRKHLLLNYIRQTFSVFGECEKNAHPRFVLQQQLTLWLCVLNQLCWRKSSSSVGSVWLSESVWFPDLSSRSSSSLSRSAASQLSSPDEEKQQQALWFCVSALVPRRLCRKPLWSCIIRTRGALGWNYSFNVWEELDNTKVTFFWRGFNKSQSMELYVSSASTSEYFEIGTNKQNSGLNRNWNLSIIDVPTSSNITAVELLF